MVQELLPLLPKELGTLALVCALAGTLIGVGLWLFGARVSRSLVTLVLVSAGAWCGMMLPRWCHWAIDGWATALGGAVVAGAAGFFCHRFWVGLSLGVLLVGWATVAVWFCCKGDGQGAWSPPKFEQGTQLVDYAQNLWQAAPETVRRVLPFAAGVAMVSGLVATLMWPRVGAVLLYSAAGVTLIVAMGLSAMNLARPQWIGALPGRMSAQLTTVLAMVAFGALLQWRTAPANKNGAAKSRKPLVIHD